MWCDKVSSNCIIINDLTASKRLYDFRLDRFALYGLILKISYCWICTLQLSLIYKPGECMIVFPNPQTLLLSLSSELAAFSELSKATQVSFLCLAFILIVSLLQFDDLTMAMAFLPLLLCGFLTGYLKKNKLHPWNKPPQNIDRILLSQSVICIGSICSGVFAMFYCCNNVCWGESISTQCQLIFPNFSSTPNPGIALDFNTYVGMITAGLVAAVLQYCSFRQSNEILPKNNNQDKAILGLVSCIMLAVVSTAVVIPATFKLLLDTQVSYLVRVELEALQGSARLWLTISSVTSALLGILAIVKSKSKRDKVFLSVLLYMGGALFLTSLACCLVQPQLASSASYYYHQTLGQYSHALKDINNVILSDRANADLYKMRALTYLSLNQREKAAKDFVTESRIGIKKYGLPRYTYSEAQINGRACRPFNSEIKSPEYQTNPIDINNRSGDLLRGRGDLISAKNCYLSAAKGQPRYATDYCALNYAYGRLKMYDKAEFAAIKAVQIYPYDVRSNFILGLVHNSRGYFEKAITDSSITIGLSPKFSGGYCNRGIAYYALGHYELALSDLNKSISLDSNVGRAFFFRSKVLKRLGKSKLAKQDEQMYSKLNYTVESDMWPPKV